MSPSQSSPLQSLVARLMGNSWVSGVVNDTLVGSCFVSNVLYVV